MKFSKLDPMTILMLAVAFGVVITMLTQNSVASVERTSLKSDVIEKSVSTDTVDSGLRLSDSEGRTLHVSYGTPGVSKETSAIKGRQF